MAVYVVSVQNVRAMAPKRPGEAGLGFAVVTDKVRVLVQRASDVHAAAAGVVAVLK